MGERLCLPAGNRAVGWGLEAEAVVPEGWQTHGRGARQIVRRARYEEVLFGLEIEFAQRELAGARVRFVEPGALGGDDDAEVDVQPGGFGGFRYEVRIGAVSSGSVGEAEEFSTPAAGRLPDCRRFGSRATSYRAGL